LRPPLLLGVVAAAAAVAAAAEGAADGVRTDALAGDRGGLLFAALPPPPSPPKTRTRSRTLLDMGVVVVVIAEDGARTGLLLADDEPSREASDDR
jgi:hypothetical protein